MKKIITVLFVSVIALLMSTAVWASDPLVVDEAGLISSSDEGRLTSALESIQSTYGYDVIVLTVDSTDGQSLMTYADDYYDNHDYAEDGVLLCINMDTDNGGASRGWWISTCGRGIKAFTDYGIEQTGGYIRNDLSNGSYGDAFLKFAEAANTIIGGYESTGIAYDTNWQESDWDPEYEPPSFWSTVNWFIVVAAALIVGIIVATASVNSGKRRHKTVRSQQNATVYTVEDSVQLTAATDTFLYSNLAVVPIPKEENRGGGGGGSSSF